MRREIKRSDQFKISVIDVRDALLKIIYMIA